MAEENGSVPPRLVGLSIEPGDESPHDLVLKLGSSRFWPLADILAAVAAAREAVSGFAGGAAARHPD